MTLATNRFPDLASPGFRLATEVQKYRTDKTVVLGIANGGVPAAGVVARQLEVPLDIVLIKRLLAPRGPQDPVCATNVAGTLVLDEEVPAPNPIPGSPLDHFLASALNELARRDSESRTREPLAINGKDIVLVDNGIHTGSTMTTAIRAIRKLDARRIFAAVPVAAAEVRLSIERATDEFVCLVCPENFGHVGLWYSDFTRPSNEQIREILERSRSELRKNFAGQPGNFDRVE